MAQNQFGRAQIIDTKPYRSPGWDYLMQNKEAMRKKLEKDSMSFDELDELKSWEDQRNFEEITTQMKDLEGVWNEAFKGGFNIANPTTKDEMRLQRAFEDRKTKIRNASELYNTQGEAFKAAFNKMQSDKNVDVEATRENLRNYIDDEGDVFQRAQTIPSLVAYKTEPVDIMKTVTEGMTKYTSVDKTVLENAYDPETGKIKKKTWEGIPLAKREEALDKIWKFSGPEMQDQIKGVMRSDVANNLDPNKPEEVEKYFKNEFKNVKSGGKVEETWYSVGEGGAFDVSFKSGIPKQDESGVYESNADTVQMYNPNSGVIDKHTSPYAINLQGIFQETPSNAVSIEVTSDMINTQDGKPEAEGGIYSVLPTKVIWMPVASEDAEIPKQGFDKFMFIKPASRVSGGKIISDDQMAKIQESNDQLAGSGQRVNYTWEPFVMARTKYGQVEADDDIKTFNRSDYVPLDVVNNDLRAKATGNGIDWDQYENAVKDISKQLNAGIIKPGTKKKYDM